MVEDETSGTGTVTPSRNDWISAVEIDDGKLINPNVHAPKAISMFRNPYGYCVCVCVCLPLADGDLALILEYIFENSDDL